MTSQFGLVLLFARRDRSFHLYRLSVTHLSPKCNSRTLLFYFPGPPLFSLTVRLRNPFPCPVTFFTGQRLLKQSFPDSASRLCTVGSATRPSSHPLSRTLYYYLQAHTRKSGLYARLLQPPGEPVTECGMQAGWIEPRYIGLARFGNPGV